MKSFQSHQSFVLSQLITRQPISRINLRRARRSLSKHARAVGGRLSSLTPEQVTLKFPFGPVVLPVQPCDTVGALMNQITHEVEYNVFGADMEPTDFMGVRALMGLPTLTPAA